MSDRTASFLSQHLRKHALDSGWPSRLAMSLGVNHRDGHYVTSYPEHLADDVLDLEYGTPGSPPSPAIRQFHNRAEKIAGGMHTDEALLYLDEMGIL